MRFLILLLSTFAVATTAPVQTNRSQDLKDYFSNRITYQALIDYQKQIRAANAGEP